MNSATPMYLETELKLPGWRLPVRTVVIQLSNARVLFGPGSQLTDEQYRSAGEITDVVAPSILHTGGMARAAEKLPAARLWGPEGSAAKLPSLKWHGTLAQWPYADELPLFALGGMPKAKEYLAIDRASRSLLATDFVFNLDQASGIVPWIALHIFGTYRRFAVSRLFLSLVKDREAFKQSLPAVVAQDFDRVVPSHGAVLETDGKARVIAALKERKLIA